MSEKNKEYFENQIKGLLMIMEDAPEKDIMVARSYVKEKLNMILKEGINFHPVIIEKRSFSESIAYFKAQFDVGEIDEETYKMQIAAILEGLKNV